MIFLPIFFGDGNIEPPESWEELLVCLVVLFGLIYGIITLFMWLMPLEDSITLVEVFKSQWKWITSLRIW